MFRRAVLLPFLFVLLVGARVRPVGQPTLHPPRDIFTFSDPRSVVVRHLDLDLAVDFPTQTIRGTATLHLQNLTGARQLVLDTRSLVIEGVTRDGGTPANFSLATQSLHGAPLTIAIEPSTRSVSITYRTTASSPALTWATAAQSYGRQQPFLYTQSESYHLRSWIPMQDTPGIRVTYDATVRVPPGMLALMSAENPTATNGTGVYTFRMREPIPPYLIALAVARLEFRPLDERTGVYAEPELIEVAAHEIRYVPEMLDAAERIAGPYPFERYDVLFMPPTYGLGGMEHARLNFLNPFSSVLSGNRPDPAYAATLLAHEMAHSWAGDSATLATWSDAWLNEGITSYLSLRFIEEIAGPRRAEYHLANDHNAFANVARNSPTAVTTILHRNLTTNNNPDDLFNSAAYLKGELFMQTLEDVIGRERFDAFLREYFAFHRFRWVDDVSFLTLLRDRVIRGDAALEQQLRLNEWIYSPGLPSNVTAPGTSALRQQVDAQAQAFMGGARVSDLQTSGWGSIETELFLSIAQGAVTQNMAAVDAHFGLSAMVAPPPTWLTLSARRNYEPARPAIERMLLRAGPNNFMRQLYEALAQTSSGRAWAQSVFNGARSRYERSVEAYIAQVLSQNSLGSAGETPANQPAGRRRSMTNVSIPELDPDLH